MPAETPTDERVYTRETPSPDPSAPRLTRFADLLGELEADDAAAHEAYTSGTPPGPVTGLAELDRELGGALAPGTHVLHAGPGAGKTALAVQITSTCGFPALFVSCEMSALELLRRHTARVTWTHPDGYGLTARWRYFSSTEVDDLSEDEDLSGSNTQPGNDRLRAVSYLDLALSFRVGDHYNFRLGMNNVLDTDPPTVGSQVCPSGPCNGNVWAQVYDALGRYVFAGVTLDF